MGVLFKTSDQHTPWIPPPPALLVKTIRLQGQSDLKSSQPSLAQGHKGCGKRSGVRELESGVHQATPAAQTRRPPGVVTWLRHGPGSTEAADALPAAGGEPGQACCLTQGACSHTPPLPALTSGWQKFGEGFILEDLLAFRSSGIDGSY